MKLACYGRKFNELSEYIFMGKLLIVLRLWGKIQHVVQRSEVSLTWTTILVKYMLNITATKPKTNDHIS